MTKFGGEMDQMTVGQFQRDGSNIPYWSVENCRGEMAANFWTSSHYKQLLDQQEVDFVQALDKDNGISLEYFKLIKMHMANYTINIGSTHVESETEIYPLSQILLQFRSCRRKSLWFPVVKLKDVIHSHTQIAFTILVQHRLSCLTLFMFCAISDAKKVI